MDEEQLREEIDFLKRTWSTKVRLASLRADRGLKSSGAKVREPYNHSNTKIALLMDWVNAVCDFYGLQVRRMMTHTLNTICASVSKHCAVPVPDEKN